MSVGELLQEGDEKNVLLKWPKVYPVFVSVLFASPRPSASSGTARIIPTSLSAPWSVWEPHKSAGCALYICHPLCWVKEKKKICSTPGLWFARLLIPGAGYNSSLPPSYSHCCSLPLTFMLFLFSWPLFFLFSPSPVLNLFGWSKCIQWFIIKNVNCLLCS